MTLPDELPGHSKVVWHAEAVAEHPDWVQLTDDSHPLGAGHPLLDEGGNPVPKPGHAIPVEWNQP